MKQTRWISPYNQNYYATVELKRVFWFGPMRYHWICNIACGVSYIFEQGRCKSLAEAEEAIRNCVVKWENEI